MERRSHGSVSVLMALLLNGGLLVACAGDPTPPAQSQPAAPATRAEPAAPPPTQPPSTRPPSTKPPASRGTRVTKTFELTILSRGAGVPAAATEAAQQLQKLVDADRERGISVTLQTTRIGIEGERRLCVTYESASEGSRMLERVRAIVKDVDLVNLVEGSCTTPQARSPKKENPS